MIFRTFLDELLLFFTLFWMNFAAKLVFFFQICKKIDGESDFFRLSPKMLRETIILHIGVADLIDCINEVG